MDKQQLRSLTDQSNRKQQDERTARLEEQRKEIFARAEKALKVAASEGRSEAIVGSVTDLEEHLIAVPSAEDYPDTPLKHLTLGRAHLRGALAELWDKLAGDGLYLQLRMHVEGHSCNSACYVWDLVAQW